MLCNAALHIAQDTETLLQVLGFKIPIVPQTLTGKSCSTNLSVHIQAKSDAGFPFTTLQIIGAGTLNGQLNSEKEQALVS